MDDENIKIDVTEKPKKRPFKGRNRDELKKARLNGHVTGDNCFCKRFKCFEMVDEHEQARIIAHFNALSSKDEQDSLLSGLIEVLPVKRRRSRKTDEPSFLHDYSCQYSMRIEKDGAFVKIPVCVKGFCSIFGITKELVRRIRNSISETGKTAFLN